MRMRDTTTPVKKRRESAEEQMFPIIDTLTECLSNENNALRTAAVEGFTKLLFTDVFDDQKVVAKLILEMFNPMTESYHKLRRCLEVFFPNYSVRSYKHFALMEKATLLAIMAALTAPQRGVMAQINIINLASYLFPLTGLETRAKLMETAKDQVIDDIQFAHNRLGTLLLKEVLISPLGREGTDIPQILNLLQLNDKAKDSAMEMRVLNEKALKDVKDKSALKQLDKFKRSLLAISSDPLNEKQLQDIEKIMNPHEVGVNTPSNKMKRQRSRELLEAAAAEWEEVDKFELLSQTAPTQPVKKIKLSSVEKRRLDAKKKKTMEKQINEMLDSVKKKVDEKPNFDQDGDGSIEIKKILETVQANFNEFIKESTIPLSRKRKRSSAQNQSGTFKKPAPKLRPHKKLKSTHGTTQNKNVNPYLSVKEHRRISNGEPMAQDKIEVVLIDEKSKGVNTSQPKDVNASQPKDAGLKSSEKEKQHKKKTRHYFY